MRAAVTVPRQVDLNSSPCQTFRARDCSKAVVCSPPGVRTANGLFGNGVGNPVGVETREFFVGGLDQMHLRFMLSTKHDVCVTKADLNLNRVQRSNAVF